MARRFLYVFAFLVVLIIAGAVALTIWSRELTELALVPSSDFVEQSPLEANAYQDPAMWYSRPGIGVNDPSRWQPPIGEKATDKSPSPENPAAERSIDGTANTLETVGSRRAEGVEAGDVPDFAVFFVHPTSYIERASWNAPPGDERADRIARVYLKGMASPFNRASEIWAPKYRQATMGAFLTKGPEGQRAIDAAYDDVQQAFEFFVASVSSDTPIVLAGHSQGALHLIRLLREEVAGTPLERRIAAAYVVGWPISVQHDLPALALPACATPGQANCIMSWSSYAEPADPSDLMEVYRNSKGFNGQMRGDSPILCTNPLTGGIGGSAPASRNLGTLVPDDDLANGSLVAGSVPARCAENGLLLIGAPPEMGSAVLPGNNYHVYDIPLFWRNLQEDVTRRVRTWTSATS